MTVRGTTQDSLWVTPNMQTMHGGGWSGSTQLMRVVCRGGLRAENSNDKVGARFVRRQVEPAVARCVRGGSGFIARPDVCIYSRYSPAFCCSVLTVRLLRRTSHVRAI